jgi:2-succinyl-6-hydroxy-2,4-cyclohexadiene-1-carboxylate synthase
MTAVDPGELAYDEHGPADAPRMVLLHGFTQTARCWAPFDAALAEHHQLRLVDAPGHGASRHAHADLVDAAWLVGVAGGPATYVGYSMGGRIALQLALDSPDLVRRLVLISASPGLADHAERAARRERDDALAEHLEAIGVAAFLDEWLAQPLFASLPPTRAHRTERERNTAPGLAASLRALGTGAQQPLWDRLRELRMPVLLVAGVSDAKFVGVAQQMAEAIGVNAQVALVEGAGHTAHLEQPALTASLVLDWLRRTA